MIAIKEQYGIPFEKIFNDETLKYDVFDNDKGFYTFKAHGRDKTQIRILYKFVRMSEQKFEVEMHMDKLFYMPQKAFFFAGSVHDNLIYGLNREVSENEMMDALTKACLLDVLIEKVEKMNADCKKNVLFYQIGEGGTGLSGGECQRLSIARTFLRKSKIYIFDESMANLDAITADKVLIHIESYAKSINAGIVYISHDKSVIDRCDRVIQVVNKVNLTEDLKIA